MIELVINKRLGIVMVKEKINHLEKFDDFGSILRIINTPFIQVLTKNNYKKRLINKDLIIINHTSDNYQNYINKIVQKLENNPDEIIHFNKEKDIFFSNKQNWINHLSNKSHNNSFLIKNKQDIYKITNIKDKIHVYSYKTNEYEEHELNWILKEDYIIEKNNLFYNYLEENVNKFSNSKIMIKNWEFINLENNNEAKMITTNTGVKWTKLPEDIITNDKEHFDRLMKESEEKVKKKLADKKNKITIKKSYKKETKENKIPKTPKRTIPQEVLNNYRITLPEKCISLDDVILNETTKERIDSVLGTLEMQTKGIHHIWKKNSSNNNATILALYGYAGTGKTSVVQGISKKLNKPILQADFADISSKWMGEDKKNLKNLFNTASKHDLILFFDEADTLLRKRTGGDSLSDKSDDKINNVFMQELDRFKGIIILTTNIIQSLDGALKSRIQGTTIFFELPDEKNRQKIFNLNFESNVKKEKDLDLWIAKNTEGFSGRDIVKMLDSVFDITQYRIFKKNENKSKKEIEQIMISYVFKREDFISIIKEIKFNKEQDNKRIRF